MRAGFPYGAHLGATYRDTEPMSRQAGPPVAAVIGMIVFAALVTSGCGRRDQWVGADAAATRRAATPAPTTVVVVPEPGATQPAATAAFTPAATNPPVASQSAPTAALAPPDLTSIERLLDDLEAALGEDAAAGADEGSSQ